MCPVRLGVRTPPFHGGNTGSNPVPDTNLSKTDLFGRLPFFLLFLVRIDIRDLVYRVTVFVDIGNSVKFPFLFLIFDYH